MSKTPEEVDAIMESINPRWRYRWCTAELCACVGCVQTDCKRLAAEKMLGKPYRGDPEYIDPYRIPPDIRKEFAITQEDWQAWVERHPQPESEKQQYGVTWSVIPLGGAKGDSP